MMHSLTANRKKWLSIILFVSIPIISSTLAVRMNYIDLILLINTVIAICFLYFEYRKEKIILTLGNAFTIYWYFYTNSIWLNFKLGEHQNIHLEDAMTITLLSMVGFIVFQLIYFPGKSERVLLEKYKEKSYNYSLIKYVLTLIFFFALFLEALFFIDIGINRFIFASRPERVLLIESANTPTFFNDLLFIVFILGFIVVKLYPTRWMKLLVFSSTASIIIYQLIVIDRSGLLKIIFPLLFFLLLFKHLKNKTVIVAGTILFFFLSYFKVIMSKLIFKENTQMGTFRFNSEFESWYFVGMNVLNDLKFGVMDHLYGKSYLEALFNLVFPITNTEPLSVWYVRTYHYATYLSGGGKAFSSIAEAIMNFGYLGVPLYFALLGLWCRWLKKRKHLSVLHLALYAFTFTVMYKFFRSELYSLTKTSWWYFILPVILILFISVQKKRHNKVVKMKNDSVVRTT